MISLSAPLLGGGTGTSSISEGLSCTWPLCFALLQVADSCPYRTSTNLATGWPREMSSWDAGGEACPLAILPCLHTPVLGPCLWYEAF